MLVGGVVGLASASPAGAMETYANFGDLNQHPAWVSYVSAAQSLLTVKTRANYRHRYTHPGDTILEIKAPLGWKVFVSFRNKAPEEVPKDEAGVNKLEVIWSCTAPGYVLHYVVSTHSDTGPRIAQRGVIREGSSSWCRQVLQDEARARREAAARNGTFSLSQFAQKSRGQRERYVVQYMTTHPDDECYGGRPTPSAVARNVAGALAELKPGTPGQAGPFLGSEPIGKAIRRGEGEIGC
jgi:hypothetical protein